MQSLIQCWFIEPVAVNYQEVEAHLDTGDVVVLTNNHVALVVRCGAPPEPVHVWRHDTGDLELLSSYMKRHNSTVFQVRFLTIASSNRRRLYRAVAHLVERSRRQRVSRAAIAAVHKVGGTWALERRDDYSSDEHALMSRVSSAYHVVDSFVRLGLVYPGKSVNLFDVEDCSEYCGDLDDSLTKNVSLSRGVYVKIAS